ncbi:MAG: hypothetical protein IKJ69_06710 [Clostridia bacterium]|nr:hypothetical protein [Clostridia bacterium]
MEKEIVLKKAIIGGFDRNEVINCIAKLQEEALSAKGEAEELRSLQSRITELEALIAERDAEIERLSAQIKEAEGSLRVSKTSAQLMRESVEYADRYVESAKVIADNISEKTNASVDDAKEKVSSLLLDITGISDDVLALYTSLADLKAEYDAFMDPSEKYLAEDELETPVEGDESQAGPLDEEQSEPAVPHQGVEDPKELIRKAKERYQKLM